MIFPVHPGMTIGEWLSVLTVKEETVTIIETYQTPLLCLQQNLNTKRYGMAINHMKLLLITLKGLPISKAQSEHIDSKSATIKVTSFKNIMQSWHI